MSENNKINWFPGHMAKALNQMTDEMKKVDMLIYVLDSRAPFSCLNPKFDALSVNKPVLYVLNKSDLADDVKTEKYKNLLNAKQNSLCIVLNSTLSGANKQIEPIMKNLQLLTAKPVIYVANIGEDDLGKEDNDLVKEVKAFAQKDNAKCITLCAKIEEELASLPSDERDLYKQELGQ